VTVPAGRDGGTLNDVTPAELRLTAAIRASLDAASRHDDESIVHDAWAMQRYDTGAFPGLRAARQAAVVTAWHEAGHAVAALALGVRFSSVSIRQGRDDAGRVHRVGPGSGHAYVIAAAGQLAERLRDWSLPGRDGELRAWLATWTSDGDARRFRQSVRHSPGLDEVAAWRHCERLQVPRRLEIRRLARALLVHPGHLPYQVAAALAGDGPWSGPAP
jgi:hypothetical protein